jgi:acylphosphatase
MKQSVAILVKGNVQGVWFRKYAKEKAEELGLNGTVQNEPDGSVLLIVTGDPMLLHQLIDWCHSGSPKAEVSDVHTKDIPYRDFNSFRIVR